MDRTALTRRSDAIIQTYTRDFFLQHWRLGLGTDQPVFIVGLPRSGTTLTEQILAAHPLLHGAGELPVSRASPRAASAWTKNPGRRRPGSTKCRAANGRTNTFERCATARRESGCGSATNRR